jgi:sensor histidine kinase YesM
MKIRYVDDIEVILKLPEAYDNVKIPVLLFISYLENAFKYGASYQKKSLIEAVFEIEEGYLVFSCKNSKKMHFQTITPQEALDCRIAGSV